MKKIKVGIIGVGTVGSSVANILEENKDIITARSGVEIEAVLGIVQNLEKQRNVNLKLTTNVDDVLDNEDIDIVVELMGGVDEPFKVVKKALKNGKNVVTANKALLAYHRYELQELGNVAYEASTAGGIPIIKALKEGLSANHILLIKGIMNGTCNYILTKMMNEDVQYLDVLDEAQKLGYAEADPTFDVGGFDAAHKLLILASIAYNIDAKPEDILIEGIDNISSEDIAFAKEFGYAIKLLTIAKKRGDKVELRVHPALIKNTEMIAKVDGVMNAVSVVGDRVEESLYYGPGAGGDATASAVVADIIDIARRGESYNDDMMLGVNGKLLNEKLTLAHKDEIYTKYYVRLSVKDEVGVLAEVASIFAKNDISIDTILQKVTTKANASLLLSTHSCKEIKIQTALTQIKELSFVSNKPSIIRIES